ncbi:PhzF family phenazine biosynthesis protein [Nonomuraea sp. NPDC050790]|uniref:PhzF family phenazine biosynthesis protein n=1 Tax=Nonomuraea sp. NPDC050790 TaxID=3364371 RepID=UPI003793C6B3
MRVYTVDAFTDVAFRGNPAAVCLLESAVPTAWMQAVAAEMGLSETAFLLDNSLRWFTPAVEVSLCGHATLATAHVLYSTGAAGGQLQFETASGILSVNRTTDGMITMDFPSKEVTPTTAPADLAKALGAVPVQVSTAKDDLLVELESEEQVRTLSPDIAALSRLAARAVIVTARGVSTDFVSRFFAPKVGIPEDPVTGSAHCALAPYWGPRLARSTMTAAQLSPRGGLIHLTLRGPRVDLAGRAITILSGTLHI